MRMREEKKMLLIECQMDAQMAGNSSARTDEVPS